MEWKNSPWPKIASINSAWRVSTACWVAGEITLDWKLDSELVVKQLAGEYKVKNPGLKPLHQEIQDLRIEFAGVTFTHVRRELNKEADRLVNEALDHEAKK